MSGNAKAKLPRKEVCSLSFHAKMPSNPVLGGYFIFISKRFFGPNFHILNLFGSWLGCGFELGSSNF